MFQTFSNKQTSPYARATMCTTCLGAHSGECCQTGLVYQPRVRCSTVQYSSVLADAMLKLSPLLKASFTCRGCYRCIPLCPFARSCVPVNELHSFPSLVKKSPQNQRVTPTASPWTHAPEMAGPRAARQGRAQSIPPPPSKYRRSHKEPPMRLPLGGIVAQAQVYGNPAAAREAVT